MAGRSCKAQALGYECDREARHGMLHHDDQYDSWWIFEARSEDELFGRKPMSGYILITDNMLQ